jgi:predicted transposase YbfD/YdcC
MASRVVLGQVATDARPNELNDIPELLALLMLKGAIVTIDATGCQTRMR